jgi:hypothetical protein
MTQQHTDVQHERLHLKAGELVEVRPYDEILETLDADGTYRGLPFMPEMRKFCGRKSHVYRRANRFCYEGSRQRLMDDAVFLEDMRCDGEKHDGCGKACLVFWNEAWLKRSTGQPSTEPYTPEEKLPPHGNFPTKVGERYFCQSSQLGNASYAWTKANFKPFLIDLTSGNMGFFELIKALYITAARMLGPRKYTKVCGDMFGTLTKTPALPLGLKPGEYVQIKSPEEIMATLDTVGRNRGMHFSPEMLSQCGVKAEVLHRVEKIILERSGVMQELKDTVILKGVGCDGACRKGCPRDTYPFWREAWLKRVDQAGGR